MVQSWWNNWKKSLCGGLLWLSVLFVIDLVDSFYLIRGATKRVRYDEATTEIIVGEVVKYIGQVALGYVFLGLLAAVLLHCIMLLWHPKNPTFKSWMMTLFGFAVPISIWANFLQVVHMPTIHDWMGRKWQRKIADGFDPEQVLMIGGGIALLLFVGTVFRWRGLPQLSLAKRFSSLVLWILFCNSILSYPTASTPQLNSGTNVVIIGIDGLRPDHLQRNGYFRDTAPHLEALLDESVVFSNVFTPLARTYPSWIATLTGQLPINNGIRDNIISNLIPKSQTLAQAFQKGGWHTSFTTDDSRFSFMQKELGYDYIMQPEVGAMNFALSASEPRFRAFHGLMHNKIGYWLAPVVRHNQALGKSYRPELFFEASIEVLGEASTNERFFYTTHACFLHAPGDRNFPWNRLYDQQGYLGKNRFRYSRSGSRVIPAEVGDEEPVAAFAEQDEKIYDSGIAMADGLVKRIVEELKKSGLYDNTIIIVFSDHGENMWANNLPYKWHGPNHGFHPYDDGQHKTVLGIRFPNQEYAGKQIENPIRLIDLAPTLVEYFQLPWDGDFDGESLFPLMRGEEEEQPRMVYIETGMSERNYWPENHRDYSYKRIAERYWVEPETKRVLVRDEFLPDLIAGKDRVVQMGRWKLVFRPMKGEPRVEVYDREEDPHNRYDLSLSNPVHKAYLGMKMLPFLERDSESFPEMEQWKKVVAENPEPNWWD